MFPDDMIGYVAYNRERRREEQNVKTLHNMFSRHHLDVLGDLLGEKLQYDDCVQSFKSVHISA